MDLLLLVGILSTVESATVVTVIFMTRYMPDIGITNQCIYICSGSVTARWPISTFGWNVGQARIYNNLEWHKALLYAYQLCGNMVISFYYLTPGTLLTGRTWTSRQNVRFSDYYRSIDIEDKDAKGYLRPNSAQSLHKYNMQV